MSLLFIPLELRALLVEHPARPLREGHLQHLHRLNDEFVLCQKEPRYADQIRTFGANFYVSCDINLKTYI